MPAISFLALLLSLLGFLSALPACAGFFRHRKNRCNVRASHGNTIGARPVAFVPIQKPDDTVRNGRRRQPSIVPEGGCSYQNLENYDVRPRRLVLTSLLSSSPDVIINKADGSNGPEGKALAAELAEAQRLRERARNLRLEAITAEQTLRSTMQQKKDVEIREADELIDLLLGSVPSSSVPSETVGESEGSRAPTGVNSPNNNIPTAQTLAIRIRENQLGIVKLQKVVERLHERETAMMMGPEGYLSKRETSIDEGSGTGGFVLGDYENNSLESKKEETDRISGLLDRILDAVQMLDEEGYGKSTKLASKLRVRVADLRQSRDALFQRRVDNLANANVGSSESKNDGSLDGYIQSSIGSGDNDNKNKRDEEEKMLQRLIESPDWLPSSLAAFAATSPVEIPVSQWKMIKTDLLADSGFVCTSWDSISVAAIFRGRLPRAPSTPEADNEEEQSENSIASAFEDLQSRLENHSELKDRIRLFLVDDNEWRPSIDTMGNYGKTTGGWDASEDGPPPVIIALAKDVVPEQESERGLRTKALAAFSTLLTTFTSFAYALSAFALNPAFFNAVVKENDVSSVPLCLPIFAGVLAISALHEAGHFIAAKIRSVKLGFPVPLPSLQVGTFGSITPLRSFPSSRAALFDVAISGPGISMLVSLVLIISGLSLTITSQSLASFPIVPAAMMKSSYLIGSIVSIIAPGMILAPLSQPIPIHPLFLVGLAGLVMSAVNLLPIGRLDGGRAFMAAWGRRNATIISFLSLLVLAFYSFNSLSGTSIFWGAIVILCQQRLPEIPCIDEVTSVGDMRANIYTVLLVLALLSLAPFPGGVGPI